MTIVPTARASGKGATSSDEPGDSWQLTGSPLQTDLESCKLCPIAQLISSRKDFASMTMILQASTAPALAAKLRYDSRAAPIE